MIRPLQPGDAPAVNALLVETLGGRRDPAALRESPPLTTRRVFVEGGRALGFSEYRVIADEAELCELAVHPAARRRGIARRLLADLCADAAARGAASIVLEVRAGNTPARGLYAAAGFEAIGTRRRYYADGEDAALYRRPLGSAAQPGERP